MGRSLQPKAVWIVLKVFVILCSAIKSSFFHSIFMFETVGISDILLPMFVTEYPASIHPLTMFLPLLLPQPINSACFMSTPDIVFANLTLVVHLFCQNTFCRESFSSRICFGLRRISLRSTQCIVYVHRAGMGVWIAWFVGLSVSWFA